MEGVEGWRERERGERKRERGERERGGEGRGRVLDIEQHSLQL